LLQNSQTTFDDYNEQPTGALCKWGTTLLLQLFASIGCSSSVTNNIQQQNKQ